MRHDMKHSMIIAGAGGGKGGGSNTATEASDSLQSKSYVWVLDVLGEGQIGGLVNGGQSVFFNDVPMMNSDNSYNFAGCSWAVRNGSQDQTQINGFSTVETPYNSNTRVMTSTPFTFSVSNQNADQVRIIMSFPSLTTVNQKTGDINGATVQYKFQISINSGSFVDVIPVGYPSAVMTVSGKKSSLYQRSHTISIPHGSSNVRIKVIRLTADSTSSYVSNESYVYSYFEVVDSKLSYPNTALFGLKIDSSQFSSIPSRSYLIDGLLIKVPSNSINGIYSGVWDGSFRLESSGNPAWIMYDILTNDRYGLGQFVSESMINLAALYQIGVYCDERIDDGYGGKEKRFSINTSISTRSDAYDLLKAISSAFRGMTYWAGGECQFFQDSPTDPVKLITNANVVDGQFEYIGSARKDRHSVALITYNDPDNNYKQAIEYVEDAEAIKRFGIRKYEVTAFGCASRGMAHRIGLWALYSEQNETDVVTFKCGIDQADLMPGDIVKIQDQYRAGRRNSGRLTASNISGVTLDAPVTLAAGKNIISIMMPDGTFVDKEILEVGTVTSVTFAVGFSGSLPLSNAIWIITQPDLTPVLARVVEIKQSQDGGLVFEVSATMHDPNKYAYIENSVTLPPKQTTVLDPTYSVPTDLVIDESTYLVSAGNLGSKLHVSWSGKSPTYTVKWRRSDTNDNWTTETVTDAEYMVYNVQEGGVYDFSITATSVTGRVSAALEGTYTVAGDGSPPGVVTNLTATGGWHEIILNWSNPSNLDLERVDIYESATNDSATAVVIGSSASATLTRSGLSGNATKYYWAKAVNKRQKMSAFNATGGTSATTRIDSGELLTALTGKIGQDQLTADLLDPLTGAATQSDIDAAINSEANARANADSANAQSISNLTTTVNGYSADIQQAMTVANNVNAAYTAQWSVKTTVGSLTGGVGFLNDGATTRFTVAAQTFAIVDSSLGNTAFVPFVVTGGKVVMSDAFINTATINDLIATKITASYISTLDLSSVNISGGTITLNNGSLKMQDGALGVGTGGTFPMWGINWKTLITADGKISTSNLVATGGSFTGAVTATSGTFTGAVNASSGTFNNVTINSNCTILGKLSVEQLVGDTVAVTYINISASTPTTFAERTLSSAPAIKPFTKPRSVVIGPIEVSGQGYLRFNFGAALIREIAFNTGSTSTYETKFLSGTIPAFSGANRSITISIQNYSSTVYGWNKAGTPTITVSIGGNSTFA